MWSCSELHILYSGYSSQGHAQMVLYSGGHDGQNLSLKFLAIFGSTLTNCHSKSAKKGTVQMREKVILKEYLYCCEGKCTCMLYFMVWIVC